MIARKLSVITDNNSLFSAHINENCKKKKTFSLVMSSIRQRSLTDCIENRL